MPGSALIGVLGDSDCPKQRFRGYSPPWDAPEKSEEKDALGLRRMDIYSYGLTIWRIMCNGEMPYKKLFWDLHHESVISDNNPVLGKPLSSAEFIALKEDQDTILDLAVDTLRSRPRSDVNFEKAQAIFKITLRADPTSRAFSFGDIVSVLRPNDSTIDTGYVLTCSNFPVYCC